MAADPKILYEFGPFRVDPDKQVLLRADQPVPITPKAFETLLILVRRSREIVSKEELMKTVWPDAFVEEGNLSQNIFLLRKALGDTPEQRRYIVTLPGRGYRFTANVRTVTQEGSDVVIKSRSRSEMVFERTEFPQAKIALDSLAAAPEWLKRKYLIATAVAVAVLIIGAFGLRETLQPPRVKEQGPLLIGEFANTTGDPSLEGVLRTALLVKLNESPYLSVVPDSKLHAALKAAGKPDSSSLSFQTARTVCRVVGARLLLTGVIASEPNGTYDVRLNATACGSGRTMLSEQTTAASQDDVLPALDRAADALRKALGESATSIQQFATPIVQASTNSLAALKMFSLGEEKRAQGQDYETIPLYKMATDLDPNFALAYARLGIIYNNAQELEASRRYFAKAFELREHANERERLYITAHHYSGQSETDQLLQVYKVWRQLYPRDLVPANNLTVVYFALGQPEKALETARDAVRLGPDNAFPYASLMRSYRRTGQFKEAKAVYEDTVNRKLDTIVVHIERYVIAFAERDEAEMTRQLEWSRGKAQEGEILNEAGVAAMGNGQLRRAKAFFNQAAEVGLKNGLPEFAANCPREYAEFAADVGMRQEALLNINKALQAGPDSREFLASAALVFANLGEWRRAEQFAGRAARQSASDFELTKISLPTARAAAYLHRNEPEAALRELQPVEPYDLSWATELAPVYYRAVAYLQLRRTAEARQQLQKVLDNRAGRPEAAYVPLAHLGLGRAYVLEGNLRMAQMEYETFFELWKDADVEIPVLRQARAEYAKLRSY